jgi:hypothetical protein
MASLFVLVLMLVLVRMRLEKGALGLGGPQTCNAAYSCEMMRDVLQVALWGGHLLGHPGYAHAPDKSGRSIYVVCRRAMLIML